MSYFGCNIDECTLLGKGNGQGNDKQGEISVRGGRMGRGQFTSLCFIQE